MYRWLGGNIHVSESLHLKSMTATSMFKICQAIWGCCMLFSKLLRRLQLVNIIILLLCVWGGNGVTVLECLCTYVLFLSFSFSNSSSCAYKHCIIMGNTHPTIHDSIHLVLYIHVCNMYLHTCTCIWGSLTPQYLVHICTCICKLVAHKPSKAIVRGWFYYWSSLQPLYNILFSSSILWVVCDNLRPNTYKPKKAIAGQVFVAALLHLHADTCVQWVASLRTMLLHNWVCGCAYVDPEQLWWTTAALWCTNYMYVYMYTLYVRKKPG